MMYLFSALFVGWLSSAKTMVPVTLEQFSVNQSWSWAFSEFDTQTGQWKSPYLFEKYTVVQVEGAKVTIEMSSSSEYPVNGAPHHKFIADVSKCLSAFADYKTKKPWTVAFYTKSFGPQWELVSAHHKPLVFTEKFNCIREVDDAVLLESIYLQDGPMAGVAASKIFDVNYKFELIAE